MARDSNKRPISPLRRAKLEASRRAEREAKKPIKPDVPVSPLKKPKQPRQPKPHPSPGGKTPSHPTTGDPFGGAIHAFDPSKPVATQIGTLLEQARAHAPTSAKAPRTVVPKIDLIRPKGFDLPRPPLIKDVERKAKAAFDALDAAIPVLLFPVRLETRFKNNNQQLWLRIYPDQIGIDSHDPSLSEEEIVTGQACLAAMRAASKEGEDPAPIWKAYVAERDTPRAIHVLNTLRDAKHPPAPRAEGTNHIARAPILPERWCVTAYGQQGLLFDEVSAPIAPDLAFSPDLAKLADAPDGLASDPALAWMFDFEEARRKGMAMIIDLSGLPRPEIAELYVFGVKSSDPAAAGSTLTAAKGARVVRDLFAAQHADWGMGFVAQGTGTNNTADSNSDWSAFAPDLDAAFIREWLGQLPAGTPSPDAALRPHGALRDEAKNAANQLSHALGLPDPEVISRLEHAGLAEDAAMEAMNTALWPVTWGEVFSNLLNGEETSGLDDASQNWLRDHLVTTLRGGGTLPVLRSGATPYGVLPVQATTRRFSPAPTTPEALRKTLLRSKIEALLPDWEEGSRRLVRVTAPPEISEGSGPDPFADPGARLIEALRLNPHPVAYTQHQVVNEHGQRDFWYHLRNMAVHPAHRMPGLSSLFPHNVGGTAETDLQDLVRVVAGLSQNELYTTWPERFTSVEHQRSVLAQKRQFLLDLNNPNSRFFSTLNPVLVPLAAAARELASAHADMISALIVNFDYMIEASLDHERNNLALAAAFDPPASIYSGIVGEDGDDAALAYLAHEETVIPWAKAAHVVAAHGAQTIRPSQYIAYLISLAQSYVSAAPPPPEPGFPQGHKPLLYQLLRTAVIRTGADQLAEAETIAQLQNAVIDAADPAELSRRLRAMDGEALASLAANLGRIASQPRGTRVSGTEEPVARVLRGIEPAQIGQLVTALRQGNRSQEMSALASELERAAQLTRGAGALRFDRAPIMRQSRIATLVAALERLRDLNHAQLDLLMSQSLGLASWRLDAWITAQAKSKLDDMRATRPTGLQIGCFGWVQDLRPNADAEGHPAAVTSQGFIHTPSLTHAKTAAILRAGWTSYGSDAAQSPMATDLTSGRMRQAKRAFAALRQGQDLGEVIGARVEHLLRHTESAPEWIYPLRRALETLTGAEPDPQDPLLDGMDLIEVWSNPNRRTRLEAEARAALTKLGGRATPAGWAAVTRAINSAVSLQDAMADAAMADSVFSLVQGNYDRAGATLDAIATGDAPPPELSVLNVEPPAVAISHRVALFTPRSEVGWVPPDRQLWPEAAADPDLESLAAALMGSAKELRFRVDWLDKEGVVLATLHFDWAQMIDARAPSACGAAGLLARLSETAFDPDGALTARVLAYARLAYPAPSGSAPRLATDGPEAETRADLVSRWLSWQAVVGRARALHPRDFIADGDETEGASDDLDDLEKRAKHLGAAFEKAARAVLDALPPAQDGNPKPIGKLPSEQLTADLVALIPFGADIPLSLLGQPEVTQEMAYGAAWSMKRKLQDRLKDLTKARALPRSDDGGRAKRARACLLAAFGRRITGLVRFHLPSLSAIGTNFSRSSDRLGQHTPHDWIEKWGHVRPTLRDLDDALALQDCLEGPYVPMFVGQWPETNLQPWIALSKPSAEGPKASMLALTPAAGPTQWTQWEETSGLILDEIPDRVPQTHVDTGLTFHFDAPNTEAPQSLLLAVPPDGHSWSFELMAQTLRDTFNLVRIRGVDGHVMSGHNNILPAIFAGSGMTPIRKEQP